LHQFNASLNALNTSTIYNFCSIKNLHV